MISHLDQEALPAVVEVGFSVYSALIPLCHRLSLTARNLLVEAYHRNLGFYFNRLIFIIHCNI
ncbi:unnamed protein product [Trichobilharzia regenti]|nr:unnamed protein product [Trichobilharzia regenti]